MSLKIHILIVSFIILTVFVFWHWTQSVNAPSNNAEQALPREIEIVRASWGLNCRQPVASGTAVPAGAFSQLDKQPPAVRENNILQAASTLCNLKPICAIRNSPEAFGTDPAPDCTEKEIVVEYRCFSYDRPWVMHIAPRQTGVIDCSNHPNP